MSLRRSQHGFTLLEVMLAVAILALAMVALSQTLGASAKAYLNIDATRRAYMVAADKLTELQVYARWPAVGTSDDTATRGDREWWVHTKISAGPYPDTRRVDIDVGPIKNDEHLPLEYSLAGLIGKPATGNGQQGNGQQNQNGQNGGATPAPQPASKNLAGG